MNDYPLPPVTMPSSRDGLLYLLEQAVRMARERHDLSPIDIADAITGGEYP